MNPIAELPHLLSSPKPWTGPRQRGSCEKEYINWGFAVVAAVCLGLAASSQAATIYVDAAMPDDSGNGLTAQTAKKYIPSGITLSANGDIIEVNAGTYSISAGAQLSINKQVTLRAKAGLASKPTITTSYASWTGCAVQIAADNVVIDGFEITSSWPITQNPNDLVGDYYSTSSNWTVKNCNIHQGYRGIMACGNNITIQGNEIHETRSDCIDCEYGKCGGLKVTHNWLHSEHTDSGAKPAGITYNCDSTTVGDVEISYNYCNSCRTFVDFQHNGGTAPANNIVIRHNTVDWNLTALPASPIPSGTIAQQMSIAFWTGSSGNWWDASKIDIRDNIFSRQKWYAIVNSSGPGGLFVGSLNLRNNLFYQWYSVNAYYPGSAYPYEWPAARGAVGWWYSDDVAPTFANDILVDPSYAATGTTADAYYALKTGSPAMGTASDGTDIGAWQTPPVHDLTKDTYFSAIQSAIDAANPGDVIEVSAGTYNEYLSINKSLTLRGSAAGTQPTVQFTDIATSGVTVTANNVTIENLRFYRPGNDADAALLGVPKGGVWPNYTIDYSNLTLTNCTFEWGRYALYVHIQGLIVEGCQFLNNYRNGIILGGTKGTINILHNYIDGTVRSARNLVYITTGSGTPDIEGTININYNTSFNKVQFFLMDFWGVDFSKKINLNIQHNTIDYATSKPIIFHWPPANGFTKFSSIAIQDNIFSNGKLGVVVDFNTTDNSVAPSNGQIVVNNNLFFNNADDANYTKYPANPNVGWSANGPTPSGASGNMFALTGNLAGNPLYSSVAPKPNPFYTLANGFPALGTASDGTDIGAWQTPTIKIGGTVFSDNNGNGLPDAGEGIPNITVTLHGDVDGNGTQETVTTSTDADGNYLFTGLRTTAVGVNYTVTVDTADPDFPVGPKINSVDPDGGGDSTAALSLTDANPSNLNQDFGYAPTYSIGNRVFNDNGAGGGTVNNGHQDGSEPGISGVAMKLYAADGAGNPTGSVLAATNTDATGYYRFDGLRLGTYVVLVDVVGSGSALNGMASSSGSSADLTLAGDLWDHGKDTVLGPSSVLPGGVASGPVTVGHNLQPTGESVNGAGQGANGPAGDASDNLVVDFGFYSPPPTAAVLAWMGAYVDQSQVWVTWNTLSELDLIAFEVWRSAQKGGEELVTPDLVWADGQAIGHAYRAPDLTAMLPGQYTYRLVGWYDDGSSEELAKVKVSLAKGASPDVVRISGLELQAEGMRVQWQGGQPPYTLEYSPQAGPDASWTPVGPAQPGETEAVVPTADGSGFFRVRGSAGQP